MPTLAACRSPPADLPRIEARRLTVPGGRVLFLHACRKDRIETGTIAGLRDRALIGVLVYSFPRVSAASGRDVEDYYPQGRRMWFRLREKGGKHHEVPTHHKAVDYVDAYLEAAGRTDRKKLPLFTTVSPGGVLTETRLHRSDALRMINRRARLSGLSTDICCHTFRATGITMYLENRGSLEHAQRIAAHESARTTKLYDRKGDAVSLDDIEKISFQEPILPMRTIMPVV